MRPKVHYDPANTAAYAVDKTTIRTLYALAARGGLPLRHLDIASEFSTELYHHDKAVYVRQMGKFDGTVTHPDSPIGRLRLNLYGTKTACNIFHGRFHRHMKANGFTPSSADPCVYIKREATGTELAGVTIDDFIIMAQTTQNLHNLQRILEQKYRVKNLGPPSSYLV